MMFLKSKVNESNDHIFGEKRKKVAVYNQYVNKVYQFFRVFLDASLHLYKRVCPSVGPSVRWLVRRSATSYFQNLKMEVFVCVFHQGSLLTSQKCRIASP